MYFFVEITNTLHVESFDLKFPETYIFEDCFKTYDEALECINKLKEEDKNNSVGRKNTYSITYESSTCIST